MTHRGGPFSWIFSGFLLVAIPADVTGQNWVDGLFPEVAHDFGTVARGSQLRYQFKLINTSNQDVHIAAYRTKCGCTDVKIGSKEIPPGTQTVIEATLDTTRFQGHKASGLTLVFDRPSVIEKDLSMTCFIRSDVMLNPGGADFGLVARGSSPQVIMSLNYHGGMSNWGVTAAQTISDHVQARLEETSRSPGGQVTYQLVATLKPSAPAGYFKDEITLQTNDPNSPVIPISVTANVQAAVTLAPAVLNLGRVKPGETVSRVVLIRSSKPFKVTGATASRPELAIANTPETPGPFHRLTLTLKAPETAGPFHATLDVSTDLANEPPARLTTFATVTP
jgi:hypothetical protein